MCIYNVVSKKYIVKKIYIYTQSKEKDIDGSCVLRSNQ